MCIFVLYVLTCELFDFEIFIVVNSTVSFVRIGIVLGSKRGMSGYVCMSLATFTSFWFKYYDQQKFNICLYVYRL